MPSGKNPPMQFAEDVKYGLTGVPSGCDCREAKVISVNFDNVYKFIIRQAIGRANEALALEKLKIEDPVRGEDLKEGGNIVTQFLKRICLAEITITDITGLNPNVLLEYGIRLSIRDSLNILICHRGVKPPLDIADQRWIEYTEDIAGADKAREDIVDAILHSVPALRPQNAESADNLFRRTVELHTGRLLERRLVEALIPAVTLAADLAKALGRIGHKDADLRDRTWVLLERVAKTLSDDAGSQESAIEVYRVLTTTLEGFNEKRHDIFMTLNRICSADPNRAAEAEDYLKQANALKLLTSPAKSSNDDFLKAEALAAVRSGNIQTGIDRYREYLASDANASDDDAWAALGGAHRRSGDIDSAIGCYGRAYELNPSSTYALVNLVSLRAARISPADRDLQEREVKKAIRLCRERIEGDHASFWDWYDLATLHLFDGASEEAEKLFSHAVALTPETAKHNFRSVLSNLRFLQERNPGIVGLENAISLIEAHAR